MKIVMPGGSGQVGTILARALTADGHQVVVLSRKPASAAWRVVAWDGEHAGSWAAELEGADAVINLAGHTVNCRYHRANRELIVQSRVRSTRAVGRAIAATSNPPRVWLQASTATIYAHRYEAPHDETSGMLGGEERGAPSTWRFSIDVAKAWEQAALEFEAPPVRTVLMRSALTLGPDRGGIFDTLLRLVRVGLGGRSGDGRQFVSWIHEADFIAAVYWLIKSDALAGPVNVTAPRPLANAEFMRTLRGAWGAGVGLPATPWMLELGAWLLRTETELVLKSRYVVPGRLLASGFKFQFPTWSEAAADLCARYRLAARMPRKARAPMARQLGLN